MYTVQSSILQECYWEQGYICKDLSQIPSKQRMDMSRSFGGTVTKSGFSGLKRNYNQFSFSFVGLKVYKLV